MSRLDEIRSTLDYKKSINDYCSDCEYSDRWEADVEWLIARIEKLEKIARMASADRYPINHPLASESNPTPLAALAREAHKEDQ